MKSSCHKHGVEFKLLTFKRTFFFLFWIWFIWSCAMTQKAPLFQSGVFFGFFVCFFSIYIKKLEYQNIRDLPWGRQVLILSKKSRSLSVGLRSLGRPEPWPHANSQICFHHPLLPQLPSMFPRTRRAQWEKQRSLSQPDLSSSPEAATYSPVSPLTSLTCFIISEVGSIFLTREITRTQRGVSLAPFPLPFTALF